MATVQDHHQQTRILVQAAARSVKRKRVKRPASSSSTLSTRGFRTFFWSPRPRTTVRPSPSPTRSSTGSKKSLASFQLRRGPPSGRMDSARLRGLCGARLSDERRAFYDIERLRKSARPLSPAEFDAELKAALAKKTVAARKKSLREGQTGSRQGCARGQESGAKKAPAKKAVSRPAAKKVTAKAKPAAARPSP